MRLRGFILLLVMAGLSAGCERKPAAGGGSTGASGKVLVLRTPVDWPMYRGDEQNSGVAQGEMTDDWALAWQFKTDGPISASAVVMQGVVYVGSEDGSLYAITLADGLVKWKTLLGEAEDQPEVLAPALEVGDRIFVGNSLGVLFALDRDSGQIAWTFKTGGKITGSANHALLPDGRSAIVVGSYDGSLYCVSADRGEEIWRYATEDFINASPSISSDQQTVVFGGCDGKVYVLNIADGTLRHAIDIEHPNQGTVALHGTMGYIGHHGNAFVAVDLSSGLVDWSHQPGRSSFVSPAAAGAKVVVFGGRDRNVHAVSRANGQPVWRFTTGGNVDSGPLIIGQRVVVGSSDGQLYLLNLDDGAERWSYKVGQPITASPSIASDRIIVGSEDGSVYCFAPRMSDSP